MLYWNWIMDLLYKDYNGVNNKRKALIDSIIS